MQQAAWGLTVVLLAVLNVHFTQAATIGTSTTGSVAVLMASAEVSYRVGTGGSCGFGPIGDPYPDTAILSIRSTSAVVAKLPESGCGACIQLTCEDQGACSANATPVVVTVVDSCTSCSTAVPAAAFNRLAPTYIGNIAVQLQQVDCIPPGNIVIRVLEYRPTSGGYIKITPLETAGVATVSSVHYKASSAADSTYQPLRNTYGAVWEASGTPAPPLDFRLKDAAGHTVVARGLAFTAAADIPTSVQFPLTAAPVSPVAVPVTPSPSPVIPSPSPTISPPVPVLPSPSPSPIIPPSPVLPPPVVPSPAPVLPPPTPVVPPVPVTPPPSPPPSPAIAPATSVPMSAPPLAPLPAVAPVTPAVSPLPFLPVAPVQPVLAPPPVVAVPPAVAIPPVAAPVQPVLAPPPVVAIPPAVAVPPVAAVPPVVPPVALPPIVAPPTPVSPVPAPSPAPIPAAAPAPVASPPVPVVSPVPSSPAFPPAPTGPCQNVLQILQSNPSLTTWLSILQDLGQATSLGNDRLNITMFAPLNSAFNAPLPTGSTLGSGTMGQLLQTRPELKSPIAGYHVVAGAFPTSSLTPGTSLPTVDVERTPGQPDRPVILNVTAPLTLQGVGSSAHIVQPDLKTCGPSIVHVIDGVLLPFSTSTGPAAGG